MDPGALVRSTRERLGLSQRKLALRASTTQAAISRIERGTVSPTFATLRQLMLAMGEEPQLSARRFPTEWDALHFQSTLARSPEERLRLALSWNQTGRLIAAAGEGARGTDGTDQPLDPERIFAALDAHEVEYVVVGGLAVQAYGGERMTNDIDLIPAPTPENLERLAAALAQLRARVLNPGAQGLATLSRTSLWQFATAHGDIDVLLDAPGAASFAQLRERALVIALGDRRIAIAGRDDLISMKRARGRPVDLADIAALTEPEHRRND